MEGGVFSSYAVSPGRNFGLCPAGLALDQMSAQNCVPNSMRGAISFVSGHDRLESWPNLFACADMFEFKQKKSENGVILHAIGSTENAMHKDEHLASDCKIPGKSCLDSATLEKISREILLKQNNCVHKQKRVGNSVTLLPEHTQKAFGKESFPNSQSGCSRLVQLEKNENLLETKASCKKDDKMSIFGHGTRYHEKYENVSEIEVNLNIYDEGPIAVSQTTYAEVNRNLFSETDVTCKRHDKRHISDRETGDSKNVLQPGNKAINSSFNTVLMVEQSETCLEMPINYRAPCRKASASSQSGFSSCFSNLGEKDRNSETAVQVNCKSRSAGEDCVSFKNQASTPLEKLTYKLEPITDANKGEMTVLNACVSSGLGGRTVAGEEDLEKEWCISILKKYGLLDLSYGESAAIEHPGVVGDGSCEKKCKLCGSLEDSTGTLICDMCEESFHVTCCLEVNSISFEDDWYCPTCRRKRKRPVSKSFLESRDNEDRLKFQTAVQEKASDDKSDLFWHMLQDNDTYMTKVRIGKEYQADVPDWTGSVTDSPGNPFMGKVISSEEVVLLEELARQKMKNDIWATHWKSAKYLPTYPKENLLQPRNVVYIKGGAYPHGRRAKKDMLSGKWRGCTYSRLSGCSQVPYDRPYRPVTLYDRPPRVYNQPDMPCDQPAMLHVLRGGPPGQFA